MSTSSVVTIPAPCTEPWEQMTATTGGRHCTSCQKTVQDFSAFSDRELANWLSTYKGEATCGRFHIGQLERPIHQVRSAQPGNGGWVRWALALVLGWQTAKAQTTPSTPVSSPAVIQPKRDLISSSRPLLRPEPVFHVTGQVLDDDGRPYTQVVIQNESAGTAVGVDSEGKFRLPIYASDQKKDSIRVLIQYSARQYINVSTKQEQAPLLITVYAPMPSRNIVGGGLLVIRQEPAKRRSFWQFLSGKR